jgi:hypothetical protein
MTPSLWFSFHFRQRAFFNTSGATILFGPRLNKHGGAENTL